ncbi:MAG: hypothetical protein ACQEXJ_05245 [Myxococcota bacterium]
MEMITLLPLSILAAFLPECACNATGQEQVDVPDRPAHVSAVWAQEGGDKVPREELRAAKDADAVHNSVWDGERIRVFGARNETVSFAVVLEAGEGRVDDVSVRLSELDGPGDAALRSKPADKDDLFDWTGRPVELFYVRYLPIEGLSRLMWEGYDERHVPEPFRRPHGSRGDGSGGWKDRPHHDHSYPDIAVPIELEQPFRIKAGTSQMIWVDVTIPKDAPAGPWNGELEVREGDEVVRTLPVHLDVRDFTLPDEPPTRAMAFLGYGPLNERYVGEGWPQPGAKAETMRVVQDRHFQMARRHRLALFDSNEGPGTWKKDAPRPGWEDRLDGSLYRADRGYAGPAEGRGDAIFVIGAYGKWGWKDEGEDGMRRHTDVWAKWFEDHAPKTDVLLYLIDESDEYAKIERWASWMDDNPGPGKAIHSFATLDLPTALDKTPSLDVVGSTFKVAPRKRWERALRKAKKDPERRFFFYNGGRPATGSFAIEDDGVALRQVAWAQHKEDIPRWFYWHTTYYDNYQGGQGDTNVFRRAQTFGGRDKGDHDAFGRTGWNYANGDGVLFYPGTDEVFPDESYGVKGPLASLRLKYWRRGLQDAAYLAMAEKVAPRKTRAIVRDMVPKVLWEYGVDDPEDPTWTRTDISWSNDPDDWEEARRKLADLIEASEKGKK